MRRRRVPFAALIAVWALSLLVYGAYFQGQWAFGERPVFHITGDEPHYLTIATSLIRDGDLAIYANYRDKDYAPFYPFHVGDARDPQDMHALYGRDGALYSKHRIGLPLLILPAMMLGGHGWATVFMMGVTALLSTRVLLLVLDVSRNVWAAALAWISVAFSPPLLLYAHQIYPEVPGALLAVLGMHAALRLLGETTRRNAAMVGMAVALLPWLHLRYVPIAAALTIAGVFSLWRHRHEWRLIAPLGAPPLVAALALLALDWRLFGAVPTVSEYGSVSATNLLAGAPGLLLDRQFGLLPYAPVYLTAFAGIVAVRHALGARGAWLWVGVVAGYAAFIASFSYWYGAFSPPARMLVPVAPLLVVPLALALGRWRAAMAVHLVLMALTFGIAKLLMDVPRLRYNLPDGQSGMLTHLSQLWGHDVSGWLPSYIAPSAGSYVWAATAIAAGTAVWVTFGRSGMRGQQQGRHRRAALLSGLRLRRT